MAFDHPLGLSCRTRRVNDVRIIIRLADDAGSAVRGSAVQGIDIEPPHTGQSKLTGECQIVAVGDQKSCGGIVQHTGQALRRGRGVERHVYFTGFESPQHGGDHLCPLFEQQGHRHLRRVVDGEDGMRDAIGVPLKFRIRPGMALILQRQAVGIQLHLLLKTLRDRLLNSRVRKGDEGAAGMVALRPYTLLFRRQSRQVLCIRCHAFLLDRPHGQVTERYARPVMP